MLHSNHLVTLIREVLQSQETLSLHEPLFQGNEWHYVKECLDTGWVSSVGKFVDRFESDLAQFTGAKYAVVTMNGTAAMHICYLLAGVQPNDEVLVPTLTFVGTINPLQYCGAIPHFIDAEEQHLGIDPEVLDDYLKTITHVNHQLCMNKFTGRPIRALCVMHTLGHPVDLDPLLAICQKYHLHLIEDAAEALGSYYKKTHVGHYGLMGALSFNGNKIMTTGGGGAILTNDAVLAKTAKHLTTTAKKAHPWAFEHDRVGYNYRLPNLNAALGCAQLEQVPVFLRAKRLLALQYQAAFENRKEVTVLKEPPHSQSNYWLNAFLLNHATVLQRDELLERCREHHIFLRPLWNLQHTLPMYQHCPRMPLPIAEKLSDKLIKLPSSPQPMLKKISTVKMAPSY